MNKKSVILLTCIFFAGLLFVSNVNGDEPTSGSILYVGGALGFG